MKLQTYAVYELNFDPTCYYVVLGFPVIDKVPCVNGLIFNKSGSFSCLFTIRITSFSVKKKVGYIYDDNNIDKLLFERHLSAKVRRSGGKTFNPKKRSKEDDERLYKNLVKLINIVSTKLYDKA